MDWRYNTIWFDQIEDDKLFLKDFKENTINTKNKIFNNAEYAIFWHLKEKLNAFDNIESSENILFLELNWANIKNFTGIEKFNNLKRLELHYCVKLETDENLGRLKNNLEFIHINQSKKFKISDELLSLSNLKVLCLNSCAPIESLDFLKNFPKLIDFRFVDTNIIDGNLNPILEHPTLKNVGFLDKRHYNWKSETLKKELTNNDDYKKYVKKGEYQTFRYDYD